MALQLKNPARRRVIVDAVSPGIPGGQFFIKRVLGDAIQVRANVFADSHDLLIVYLRYRQLGSADWQEQRMRPLGNDEWDTQFTPAETGAYEYTVAGLVDHWGSWREGFIKKAESGQKLDVELQIGGELLIAAALRAVGEDKERLQGWGTFLADNERDLQQRLNLARSDELHGLMERYPDRSLETALPEPMRLLVERELAACSAWYEFFPRSARHDGETHGTFRDAARLLPEIARLGFDIAYLPPIHPIGRIFRKGRNNSLTPAAEDVGSPWAIGSTEGGHKAIHPELGDFDDFEYFRQQAEHHGLEVALDIAFQCAPDHPYVKEHPQWFKWRPDGTVQYAENPPKKYQDILPFNFETDDWENLWEELKSVFEFWIERGVKVFRVDNPHTKSFPFWNWCITELKAKHPELIFLAEAFTRPKRKYWLAKAGYTHGYTYFTWRNSPQELRAYVEELTQTPVRDFFWPNFWPNTPDILHEDLQLGNRATFLGRYILAATLSSNHGIYGPAFELMDKEPFPGKEEYNHNEKYQLKDWDWDQPGNLKEEIKRVNFLRREHAALRRTHNITFVDVDNTHFIAYLKQNFDRSSRILVVVNMDWHWTQMGHLTLPLEALGIDAGREFGVRDLNDPTQPVYRWQGTHAFIKLDPQKSPAHIFEVLI
ncbi:MAG: alpha amylase catalytic subunit [Puniceicoccaceae bacterium 5H]|nr:MAG: alpha amylase catalytic subunit [Puniceicoccaceae bacterium 5H]